MSTTNELITEAFYRILTEEDLSANKKEIIQNLIVLADKSAEKIAEYLTKMNNVFANPELTKNPGLSAEEKKKLSKFGLGDLDIHPRHLEKIKDEPEDPTKVKFYLDANQPDYYNELVQKLLDDYEIRHEIWKQQMTQMLKNSAGFSKGQNLAIAFTRFAEKFKKEWGVSFWYPFVEAANYFPETKQIVKDLLDASEMPETKKAETVLRKRLFREIRNIQTAFKDKDKVQEAFYDAVESLTNKAIEEIDKITDMRYETVPGFDPKNPVRIGQAHNVDPIMKEAGEEAKRLYEEYLKSLESLNAKISGNDNYGSMMMYEQEYDYDLGEAIDALHANYDKIFENMYAKYKEAALKAFNEASGKSAMNQQIQTVLDDLKDSITRLRKEFSEWFDPDPQLWTANTEKDANGNSVSYYTRKPFADDLMWGTRKDGTVGAVNNPAVAEETEDTIYHDILVVPEEIFEKFKTMASKIKEFKYILVKKDPSMATPETSLDTVTNSEKFKNRPRY